MLLAALKPESTHRAPRRGRFVWWMAAFGCLFMAGCNKSEPPQFKLNLEGPERADAELYSPEKLQVMSDAMTAMFGTPDDPFVFEDTGLDLEKLRMAAGPVASDEQGVKQGLYREHCVHCHGISGDGAGPTASFLNPYPRDFRRGVFKFTSTAQGAKPTDEDIRRVLEHGIPGTAMPSFRLLPQEEQDALVEYVKYLAMRGEAETMLEALVIHEDETELDYDFLLDEVLLPVTDMWQYSQEPDMLVIPDAPRPEDRAASVAAGQALFLDENRGCFKCHGPTGLGDGVETHFDLWNSTKKDLSPEEIAAHYPLPLQEIRPRNLQEGVFRGGRRPLDLYRRIYAGIKGTPMPAGGPLPGQSAEGSQALSATQVWNLVDYIYALSQHPELMAETSSSPEAPPAEPSESGPVGSSETGAVDSSASGSAVIESAG